MTSARARPYAAREAMSGQHELDPERLGDHIDRLYRAAWGLSGSREEAEDLVQETFAQVLRRPRLVRSDDDISYLLRALRNTFFSARRAASRRVAATPVGDDLERLAGTAPGEADARIESERLYAEIAQLPPDFRDALVAIDLVGLSYREAATALRVREATVTTRLHRARKRLAAALSDEHTE